jgi:hypothetical protein
MVSPAETEISENVGCYRAGDLSKRDTSLRLEAIMSHVRPTLLLATMVCLAARPAVRPASVERSSMDRQFESLGARYVDEFTALSPVSATSTGDHRYDRRLDQVGAEARAEKIRFLRRYLGQLEAIEPAGLSRVNQVDYAMLEEGFYENDPLVVLGTYPIVVSLLIKERTDEWR